MPLPKPELDDKRFFQIAEEARALIPSRAPEWTDHNIHDPGITFIDLFAWLVEMQHYRLNRVADETYLQFFKLVGLTREPRQAAQAAVAMDYEGTEAVFIPAGTALVPVSPKGLRFETVDDFHLIPLRIDKSAPDKAASIKSMTTKSGGKTDIYPFAGKKPEEQFVFGGNPQIGDAWILGLDGEFPSVEEIRLTIDLLKEEPSPSSIHGDAVPARLKWEVSTNTGWREVETTVDTTQHLSRPGNLVFRGIKAADWMKNDPQVRATLVAGRYALPPRIKSIDARLIRTRQAMIKSINTRAGGAVIAHDSADANPAAHYEGFGSAPKIGDSLTLTFDRRFPDMKVVRLSVVLFEGDLPKNVPLPLNPRGFVPSARLKWEGSTENGWQELPIISDTTYHFSQSGEIVLRSIHAADWSKDAPKIRVTLVEGSFEIPPRIASIRTNSIRARQVETIVNEDLGAGLGDPNQKVSLKKFPLLISGEQDDGLSHVVEVLDWRAFVCRLAAGLGNCSTQSPLDKVLPKESRAAVEHVASKLSEPVKSLLEESALIDPSSQRFDELQESVRHPLAEALKALMDDPSLYQPRLFAAFDIPVALVSAATGPEGICAQTSVRRLNRLVLQRLFPDLILSDRLEIQTGRPTTRVEEEATNWASWKRVANFDESGPEHRHYVLDGETGIVRFGNGLNGRVPEPTEYIRARFYRHTEEVAGNLSAGQTWSLRPGFGHPPVPGTNLVAAQGGVRPESIKEARIRSRKVFRTQRRVVTAKDYEDEALGTPGLRIARAQALPNHNPELPTICHPGEVTVVVLPYPSPAGKFPVKPSAGFLATVRHHLDRQRLVATNVHVVGPEWVRVEISARIILKTGADEKAAREEVIAKLNAFLSPLPQASGPHRGWPFGRQIYRSEIYQLLGTVPQIAFSSDVQIALLPDAPQPCANPQVMPPVGLPYSGTHKIEMIAYEDRNKKVASNPRYQRGHTGGCCDA